ncbi:MAG: 30S ribosomal protein S2 [Gammaproteobacteria bacterium]|nr:30S ribosomal protein S2 [Gammaproteobacteria bacterium]
MAAAVSMRDMINAGVHFGHMSRYWHPKMERYIFGMRNKIHIINLEHTLPMFNEAINLVSSIAARKGKVLFVGTKYAAANVVKTQAERCNMPYVNHRWLGGMLTNYKTIRQSVKRLKSLDTLFEREDFGDRSKKEILLLSRQREKLERSLGGIKEMNGLPDALFVIDINFEHIAISEARKLKIPVIAVVDTNSNPADIDYLIPGNDDSISAIDLYLSAAADTIISARGSNPLLAAEEKMLDEELVAATEEEAIADEGDEVEITSETDEFEVEQGDTEETDKQ